MAEIKNDIDLKPFNTFGISASARYFISIRSIEDIKQLVSTDLFKREKRLIIGGGSNLLLTRDFDGLVIHNDLLGIDILEESDDNVIVTVASGEPWHPFVMHCIQKDWGGVENLSLIPGTVGAAPMQNIGAYGVEIKNVVVNVGGVDLSTGEEQTFTNSECQFGYRESIFKHDLKEKIFISSVTLRMTKKKHLLNTEYGTLKDTLNALNILEPTIQSVSNAVIKIRQQRLPDPATLGNSGSFFKNPSVPEAQYKELVKLHAQMPGYVTENQLVKIPAAWLIEQCGWKGKRIKDAGVHHQQALVLVNYGAARGEEILSLATQIQADVFEKFGIELSPEVNII